MVSCPLCLLAAARFQRRTYVASPDGFSPLDSVTTGRLCRRIRAHAIRDGRRARPSVHPNAGGNFADAGVRVLERSRGAAKGL